MTVDMLMIGVLLCIAVSIGLILAIKSLRSMVGKLFDCIDLLQKQIDLLQKSRDRIIEEINTHNEILEKLKRKDGKHR